MISKYRILTNKVLNALIQIEQNQTARLEQLREYEGLSLKYDKRAGGKGYYSVSRGKSVDGARTFHYLGSEANDTVRYVKEYRHLKAGNIQAGLTEHKLCYRPAGGPLEKRIGRTQGLLHSSPWGISSGRTDPAN